MKHLHTNALEKAADSIDLPHVLRTAARSTFEAALGQNGGGPVVAESARSSHGVSRTGLIVAGGVAGVTAASAAVSAVRQARRELTRWSASAAGAGESCATAWRSARWCGRACSGCASSTSTRT